MKDRKYPISIYEHTNSEGITEWVAEYPDIFGLIGVGASYIEAINDAEHAKNTYLDYLESQNMEFPKRIDFESLSGRVTLRVSKTTHKQIIEKAILEGVSQNQLINDAVIHYLSNKTII